jgi:hypothetical protein
VQVIVWNQLHDRDAHDFSHAGLFSPAGQAKPSLHALREIRQEYLA